MENDQMPRRKKFLSYDSLRYEKERLETFIEWSIPWIRKEDLAADGFYFLRTHDHCACVFCRGIIGSWEIGDTPRNEHKRYFSHCPFLRGYPVGNVSLAHSVILDKLPLDGEEYPIPAPTTLDDEYEGNDFINPKRKDYITFDQRLASFKKWPERVAQTPEQMAEAGFFYCG